MVLTKGIALVQHLWILYMLIASVISLFSYTKCYDELSQDFPLEHKVFGVLIKFAFPVHSSAHPPTHVMLGPI